MPEIVRVKRGVADTISILAHNQGHNDGFHVSPCPVVHGKNTGFNLFHGLLRILREIGRPGEITSRFRVIKCIGFAVYQISTGLRTVTVAIHIIIVFVIILIGVLVGILIVFIILVILIMLGINIVGFIILVVLIIGISGIKTVRKPGNYHNNCQNPNKYLQKLFHNFSPQYCYYIVITQ